MEKRPVMQNPASGEEETIQFNDIFTTGEVQHLQDLFSDATGVASLITLPDGTPVTRPSNFTRLCRDIIRGKGNGCTNCFLSGASIGLHDASGPVAQVCLNGGLWDAGARITAGGIHIATWLIGQVCNEALDKQDMLGYADKLGVSRDEFMEALEEVPEMSVEKFNKVANMLFAFTNELSERAHANLQLKIQIAGREKTNALLKESEKRFSKLFQDVESVSVQGFRPDGTTQYWNHASELLYGYTASEAIGRNLLDLIIPPEMREKVEQSIRSMAETGIPIPASELLLMRKDGSRVWVYSNHTIVKLPGREQELFCIDIDLSDRKLSEENLTNERLLLRTLIDNIPDSIYTKDLACRKTLANLTELRYMGAKSEADVLGKDDFAFYPGEMAEKFLADDLSVIHSARPVMNREEYILDDKGEKRWLLSSKLPLLDKEGRTMGLVGIGRDITDRKLAEEAIQLANQSYIDIFNAVSEAIFVQELSGKFIDVNNGACEIYRCTREELIGTGVADIAAPDLNDLDEIRQLLLTAFESGIPAAFDFWAVRKNGEIFPQEVIVNKGKYFGKEVLIAAARDITEQKQAEEILRESERKYRILVDNAFEGILIIDLAGNVLFANQSIIRTFEYDLVDQIVGRNVFEYIAAEYIPKAIEDFSKVVQGLDSEVAEYCCITSKGNRIWTESTGKAIEYEGVNADIISLRDITARKLSSLALRESEQKFSVIAENTSDGIIILDAENQVRYVSPAYLKQLGYTEDEMLSGNLKNAFSLVHPDERDAMMGRIIKAFRLKETELVYSFRIKHASGHYVWLEDNARFNYDENGVYTGSYIICRDITQRKKREQEFIAAKEKAEESDRLKSAFLANMSHEIRTPMNGILGFTELLKIPGLSGEQQQEYIEIITKSGERMLNIINDIVDISKIESGQMEIVVAESNINEQIEYIYNFFKPEADQKGLMISYINSLTSLESIIHTDREKVFAILTNLVKNALKFTKKGSIEFGYRKKNAILEFFVKDTGMGISPQHKTFIFERFRQGSESLSRDYEGAGLGLSISKAYVQMLGGDIWVESEPGVGSVFYFSIPYLQALAISDDAIKTFPINGDVNQLRNLKVLVVEDNQASDLLITIAVNSLSSIVLHAKNGLEALDICRDQPDIDLVLMDIKMPEMDGYETARQIRTFNNEVIIIAQTAYALSGDREKALEAGCNDHLSKPINKALLIRTLEKHLKNRVSIE